MTPIEQDIELFQGATYASSLQWCNPNPTFQIIANVQVGLPTLLTVPNHGLTGTNPIPAWITNVRGPSDLNTKGYRDVCPRFVTVVDANTLAVDFDSGSLPAWQGGGVLTTYAPMNLTGYTARMQLRPAPGDQTVLLELNTTNGGIAIAGASGTIALLVTGAQTEAMTFTHCAYDLQLTAPDGVTVTRLAEGSVNVSQAVTQ